MAAKKKNTETVDSAAPNVIAVDARKLSHGLKMTFEGMAMVFDSIGVDVGVTTVKTNDAKTATPADPIDPADSAAEKVSSSAETVSEEHDTTPDAEDQNAAKEAEPSATETVDAADAPVAEAQLDASEPTSAVSIDDITKIIVQKIKQNRKNNEKIGSILKTYGVAKVGDLPASKYEAFLTDLSAI